MNKRDYADSTNKLLGQLFLILAFLCLGLTIWAYVSDKEFIRSARLTNGEVIEIQKYKSRPTIKYLDSAGKVVTFRPNSRHLGENFELNEFVEVLYNDEIPNVAKLNQWLHLWNYTFVAAVFCLFSSAFAAFTLSGKIRWGSMMQARFIGGKK